MREHTGQYDKWTPEKRQQFLDLIRTTGNVSYSARQVNMSRQYLYDLRAKDASFDADWLEAHNAGIEALEQECRRRAFSGVKRVDVTYDRNGKVKHRKVITEYSDTLAIFLLKAARPNKYREVVRVENVDVSKLSDSDLEALAAGTCPSGIRAPSPETDSSTIH